MKMLLALVSCLFLTACATENLAVTGISKHQAIDIARAACHEYPGVYPYTERVEWSRTGRYWLVVLVDNAEIHGKVYKINREGRVISVSKYFNNQPRYYYRGFNYDYGFGYPYPYYGPAFYGPFMYGGGYRHWRR